MGVLGLSGQGASFVAAGAAFVVDIVVSVAVGLVAVVALFLVRARLRPVAVSDEVEQVDES